MRAAVVSTSTSGIELLEVPDPIPGPGEVVVDVVACGLCGTDLHVATGDYAPLRLPVVVGHEFAGVISAVGPQVSNRNPGDRVAVDPSLYCGRCEYCAIGRDNLCTDGGGLGTTSDGAFAERVRVRADDCYPVPSHVELETAALAEPLACAVHGLDLLPRRMADHYVVYGAGTMGLLVASLSRHAGAGSVSVVDSNQDRLVTAAAMGFCVATRADELPRAQSGWQTVIDCTGATAAIEDAMGRVRRGGTYLQFGVTSMQAEVPVSPFRLFRDEISIIGSRAIFRSFGRAVDLLAAGVIDTSRLISHRFGLEQLDEALELARSGAHGKILVRP